MSLYYFHYVFYLLAVFYNWSIFTHCQQLEGIVALLMAYYVIGSLAILAHAQGKPVLSSMILVCSLCGPLFFSIGAISQVGPVHLAVHILRHAGIVTDPELCR